MFQDNFVLKHTIKYIIVYSEDLGGGKRPLQDDMAPREGTIDLFWRQTGNEWGVFN